MADLAVSDLSRDLTAAVTSLVLLSKPNATKPTGYESIAIESQNYLKPVTDALLAVETDIIALDSRVGVLEGQLTEQTWTGETTNRSIAIAVKTRLKSIVMEGGGGSISLGTTAGGTQIMSTRTFTGLKSVSLNYPLDVGQTIYISISGGSFDYTLYTNNINF